MPLPRPTGDSLAESFGATERPCDTRRLAATTADVAALQESFEFRRNKRKILVISIPITLHQGTKLLGRIK